MPINTSKMASTMYSAIRSAWDSRNADDINSTKKMGANIQISIFTIFCMGSLLCFDNFSISFFASNVKYPSISCKHTNDLYVSLPIHLIQTIVYAVGAGSPRPILFRSDHCGTGNPSPTKKPFGLCILRADLCRSNRRRRLPLPGGLLSKSIAKLSPRKTWPQYKFIRSFRSR